MKRVLFVLTVALIMAAMMAVSAMPAFAVGPGTGLCVKNIVQAGSKQDTPGQIGGFCEIPIPRGD